MPNLGNVRQYHGPNGSDNYISDNPQLVLGRDVNNRVVLITLTTILGNVITKLITRDGAGRVTAVGRWTI